MAAPKASSKAAAFSVDLDFLIFFTILTIFNKLNDFRQNGELTRTRVEYFAVFLKILFLV